MRYFKGSSNHALIYDKAKQDDKIIVGYIDSDFAGDLNGKMSISSYLILVNGCLISWKASS